MMRWLNTRVALILFACGFVFSTVLGLRAAGQLQFLELKAFDNLLAPRTRTRIDPLPITILGITENDIKQLRRWPLTDSALANVLEGLARRGARVIGVALYRDFPVPPGTKRFTSVLQGNEQIVVVEKLSRANEVGIAAPFGMQASNRVGFSDAVVDSDGIVRRGLLFMDDGQRVFYSFGLRLALLYLQSEGIVPEPGLPDPSFLRLGATTLEPLDSDFGGYVDMDARGYQIMLDFTDGSLPFQMYSLGDLRAGRIGPGELEGRIVIVGVTSESVKDAFYTPYDNQLKRQKSIPGIVLHAHIVSQLLRAGLDGVRPYLSIGNTYEVLWILLWTLMGGTLGRFAHNVHTFIFIAGFGLAFLVVTAYTALLWRWWIPVVPPALTYLGSAGLATVFMFTFEKRERELLMQLFSKNVSRQVADTIWEEREQIFEEGRLRPEQATATVMCSDIEGFTSIAEKLPPQRLMQWLNQYMEGMTQLVIDYDGVVEDYAGDGIKATFGVPVFRTSEAEIRQDVINAVSCALAMEEELRRLNRLWEQNGLPVVYARIGINTGSIIVGTIGSADRMRYTTVGDSVNVAARLSALTGEAVEAGQSKRPLCRTLVSDATSSYLGSDFRAQALGQFSVKGRTEQVGVHVVTGGPVRRE